MTQDMLTVTITNGSRVPVGTLVSTILGLKRLLADHSGVLKELRENLSIIGEMPNHARIQLSPHTINALRRVNFIAFVHEDSSIELLEYVGEIVLASTAQKGPRIELQNPVSKEEQENHRDAETLLKH